MIKWVVPSYGRADSLLTPSYAPWVKVYVSPEELEDYQKLNKGVEVVACPEGVQGYGKAKVMNWLLETIWKEEDTEAVIILDDDVRAMGKIVISKEGVVGHEKVESEDFRGIVEETSYLAKEWKVGLFGFNPTDDPLTYNEHIPFRHHAYLDGGLQGFVANDGLRYDEKLTVKEDVDMFLQSVRLHRKTLRVDRYYLKKRSFIGKGGSNAFRNVETERDQFLELQRKWGKAVIRPNLPSSGVKSSSIRGMGAAVRVRIPIGGE